MPIIHIETNLIRPQEYQFTQTWVTGEMNVDERIFTESHDDRMFAAMTNLGYACKWYADKNFTRGDICIVTDTDGKDKRYNGEHDDLFKAIRSQREYQENRAKYQLIYGRYVGFLDRIRELANAYEINFTQNNTPLVEIQKGAEFTQIVDRNNPYLIANKKWTRQNIIRVSMKGNRNTVTCNACQKSIQYNITDNFAPLRISDGKRTTLAKNNKQLVKNFQEVHLGQHLNNENRSQTR